jgi:YbbR domain-containing protein
LDPQTIHVTLGIHLPSKTVPLSLSTEKGQSNLAYSVTTSVKTVKITAPSDVLNKIKELTVPIDVSSITSAGSYNQQVSIPLKDNDLDGADPSSVKATIKAATDRSESESENESDSTPTASSSRSSTSSSSSSDSSSSSSSNE